MTTDSRVAIITGAPGGLGGGVTRTFLDRGYQVVATDVNPTALDALATRHARVGDRLVCEIVDQMNPTALAELVDRVVARFGRIDALLNLVGGFDGGPMVWETSPEAFRRQLDLNLMTAFLVSRAVLPTMLAQRRGRIVHIASRGALQPMVGYAGYAVSKMGVIALTHALALETKGAGVTVNCVVPSMIDTPANRAAMPDGDVASWVAPETIGAVLAWLVSDEAAVISGAAIPVYGDA
ncbi:MAG: SDR family oxidoreductase [Dehalococcoidia bacterium]|nr:SDR family oxidoreductase [Dehalococcoidia bacterium]